MNETREIILAKYEGLIERAKANGEFKPDISSWVAALYLNEQIGSAMLQQKRGEAAYVGNTRSGAQHFDIKL